MSNDILVRNPQPGDEARWRELWAGYVAFYNAEVSEDVTRYAWRRLLDEDSTLHGRIAVKDDRVEGFAACVVHAATWKLEPVCYLEDLFVDPAVRGAGIGRALIDDLVATAKQRRWARLYWHTQADNPARRLYDRYVAADDFVRYQLAIN